tara:strand:- start:29242 stop:29586 length:345 start_codon:yes stop_codon:yes gene_type:complete
MEFYVNYIDLEYLDRHFEGQDRTPHFQLSYSDGSYSRDQDAVENHKTYSRICQSGNFPHLALDMLFYLKSDIALRHTYSLTLDKNAISQIDDTQKQVLEEILKLHNDLVTPRRS